MNTNALFAAALAITAPAALIQQAEAASAAETIDIYKELFKCSQEIEFHMSKWSADPLCRDAKRKAVLIYGALLRGHEVSQRITHHDLEPHDLDNNERAELNGWAVGLKLSRDATARYAERILAYQDNEYAHIPVLVAITSGRGLAPNNAQQREHLLRNAATMYTQGLEETLTLISDLDTELIETRPHIAAYRLDYTLLELQSATENTLLFLQKMNPEEAARVKRLNEEMLQKLKQKAIDMRRGNYYKSPYIREFCRSYGE